MVLTIFFLFICLLIGLKLYCLIFNVRCTSNVCLEGKTALITGGSSGIGFQIVLGLASRGCRIIIANRNIDPSIRDEIIRQTHNSNIVLKYLDLASFKSVRDLAEDLNRTEKHLDILINNAGFTSSLSHSTEDNLDPVMQVNHYSAFLLTHLLIDLLKKSPSARIIFTSSLLSHVHSLSMDRIRSDTIAVNQILQYPDSKFCNIVTADMFAEKLKSYGITCNSWHPFLTNSALISRGLSDTANIFAKLLTLFFYILSHTCKNIQDAVQTGIYLSCADEVQNVTGKFFGECSPLFKPRGAHNIELCNALWELSEKVTNLKPQEKLHFEK